MSNVKGVILDIDGTLIDSNDAHARAWVRAFGDEGLDVPFERVRPLIGMGGDQFIPAVIGADKDTAIHQRLKDAWKEHFMQEELQGVQAQRGARELVQALLDRGVRVVYGTSADEALVQGMLERANLTDFDVPATTASDVESSKPEPDIVNAAARKLELDPGEVLMVGDTKFDVTAARRAGVRVVFLRCGGSELDGNADAVFDDPRDLADHLDGLLGSSPAKR